MSDAEESSQGAPPRLEGLGRLEKRLDAFEAGRTGARSVRGIADSAGEGYRMLGQMLGGVLGGVGLGWLVDHFAHTSPWGLVGGLLIGVILSVIATVQTASRISARAAAKLGPARSVPNDEDDD